MIFNLMAGGAGLNMQVVGNPKPESPKENTLWVNTDEKITSWTVAVDEPENHAEGMVWIASAATSTAPINAAKKNTAMLYPQSAQQYTDGEWVSLNAAVYQNGAWVDLWNGYLFEFGDQHEAITGGWEAETYTVDGTVYGSIGDVIRIGQWPNQYNRIATKKKINFDGYSKLCMQIKDPGGQYTGHWMFLSDGPLGNHNEVVIYQNSYSSSQSVYSFDISSITGEYYLFLMAGNNAWISHQRIWLER